MSRCRGEHDECSHKVLSSKTYRFEDGALLPTLFADLCRCDCHLRCPVGEHARVPDEEWVRSCTCPGRDRVAPGGVPLPPGQYKPGPGARLSATLDVFRPLTFHALALAAAVGAYFASGILQVVLIVMAVLLSPAWMVAKFVFAVIALKDFT
jgi:hypothetical protein